MCVCVYIYIWDRDSSVGIATPFELDGLGIESRWERGIPPPPPPPPPLDRPWGPPSLLYTA